MSQLDEGDLDQHLGFRLVQFLDQFSNLQVGFLVGDDDYRSSLNIKLDERIAKHGIVEILARTHSTCTVTA